MKRLILVTVVVLFLSGLAITLWGLRSFSFTPDTTVSHYSKVLQTR